MLDAKRSEGLVALPVWDPPSRLNGDFARGTCGLDTTDEEGLRIL